MYLVKKTRSTVKMLLSALLLTGSSTILKAYDFQVDGIFYNINDDNKTVSVTYGADKEFTTPGYENEMTIPEQVEYNNKSYIVTSIGDYAFSQCTQLTAINFPNSITSIGRSAFASCRSLKSIEIPDQVTSLGVLAFTYCKSLENIVIGSGITTIEDSSFRQCTSLKGIVIPNNVTSIGIAAFQNCTALEYVLIGANVKSISTNAFYYDDNIIIIDAKPVVPPTIDSTTFPENIYSEAALNVPEGSNTAYRNAAYWKNFTNIQTGIKEVNSNCKLIDSFDLNGNYVNSTYKGVIINVYSNGIVKKIVKK